MACRSPRRAWLVVVMTSGLVLAAFNGVRAQLADLTSTLFQQARSKMENGDLTVSLSAS